MRTGSSLDKLSSDADLAPCLPDTAFEHITYAQLPPDLLDVYGLALVGETRIASDYEQRLETRECCDDVLHHAVGKVFLLRIAAHVLERKDGNGGLVGKRQGFLAFQQRRYCCLLPSRTCRIEPYWPVDI